MTRCHSNTSAVSPRVGKPRWAEPIATGKPQPLLLEVHSWASAKYQHHFLLVCTSPQPEAGVILKTLRNIREGCTCRFGSRLQLDSAEPLRPKYRHSPQLLANSSSSQNSPFLTWWAGSAHRVRKRHQGLAD